MSALVAASVLLPMSASADGNADGVQEHTSTVDAADHTDGAWFSTLDLLVLLVCGAGAGYFLLVRRRNQLGSTNPSYTYSIAPPQASVAAEDCFVDKMLNSGRNVLVVYGSQTGTAEDFANRISRECRRYGMRALVVDPEEYSMEDLGRLREVERHLAVFVMATYGEGDPTDNALEFIDWIQQGDEDQLKGINYTVFGLGNKTYEHYNSTGKLVDKRLSEMGATRVFELGLGDDDANIEEDFISWKEQMFPHVKELLGIEDSGEEEKRQFELKVHDDFEADNIFTGETARLHSFSKQRPPFDARNPYLAPLVVRRQLQRGGDRQLMHLELDIEGSRIRYEAGDHVAVYPVNNAETVERIGQLLNTDLDTVISLVAVDSDVSKKHPFPCPTTYRTALLHYLDITSPPKHFLLKELIDFTSDPEDKQQLQLISSNSEAGRAANATWIHTSCRQLVHVLEDLGSCRPPLDLLCELLPRLQPRYYSISSSAKVHPTRIHITCVLVSYLTPTDRQNLGVATSWLYNHATTTDSTQQQEQQEAKVTTEDGRPRLKNETLPRDVLVPCFVRKSQFRLPVRAVRPVILIGPGTGFAPMRGFIQERAFQREQGKEVGETWMFFGCRRSSEDYIYREELEQYEKDGIIKLVLAFSRDQSDKVYVTHRLLEYASDIWRLIGQLSGHVYVCGDARHMARDVSTTLNTIVQQNGGLSQQQSDEMLKNMRSRRRYSEDVWS